MKTVIKRLLSLFCIVTMLAGFATTVSASGEGLAFDMNTLGITEGMNAQNRLSEYVRRDEFAQMVVGMIMQKDVAKSMENEVYFTDISDSEYKGAVNLLAKLGYISGNGDGNFNSSGYISYGAACKILVCALGYEPIVEEKSLHGYMFVAGNIGVTKNIDSSDEYLTFEKAMKMVDNALDISLMVPMYYNNNITPSYEVDNGRTFRSYHNGRYGEGVVKLHGIVTADKSSYLYNPVPNLKDTQIVIEDKVYNYDGIAPQGYVGQVVEYYVNVNEYNEELIVDIAPTNKNTVNDFMGSQITKLEKEKLVFSNANSGVTSVKVNYETRFIYNNRIDLKYKLTDIKQNNSFVVRTVDNDEDDIAEVVFVYEYTDCIVEKVYEETGVITFKNGYALGSQRSITLDEEKITFEIYDAKGAVKTLSDVSEDEVISIAASKDGKMLRIVKGADAVRGTILSRDGDYVFIDNTEYYCDSRAFGNGTVIGKAITGLVNFAGTLVYYEEEQYENTYGYVYSYGVSGGALGDISVKMLMPEYISVKQVEGEVDELSGEADVSNSLFVRNRSVVVFKIENKIMFNGKKIPAQQALEQVLDRPVAYKIGDNGKIIKIDTLDAVDDVTIKAADNTVDCVSLNNKKYNGSEQIFGGGKGTPFAIKENYTLAFCVPLYKQQNKADVSDDDLLVYAELLNGVGYEANGYEQDENTFIADVLVVQKSMRADQTIDVLGTSKVALVTKLSDVIDEDTGAESKAVTMLTKDGERKYVVAQQRLGQNGLKNLKAGDLVAYTLDGFDNINTISILQKNDEYIDYDESEKGRVCATVTDIKYMHISNTKVRWVNIVEISNGTDINYTYELTVKNPAPVFVTEGKQHRTGSFDDVQIGDRVVIVQDVETSNVRALVIKR